MEDPLVPRRRLLQAFLSGALLSAGAELQAASSNPSLATLTPTDPTAAALAYTDDSSTVNAAANPGHTADQKCSACAQYQGKAGDARGGCNIYPGKSVSANGWCKAFAKKG